jgi:gluconolactonase
LVALGLVQPCRADPRACPAPYAVAGKVERADPRLDALIDMQAPVEKIADGFGWSEGPIWLPKEQALVLSDVPGNTAYRWSETDGIGRFLAPSGFSGPFDGEPHQGSNGIKRDAQGRLIICQHGDRRVVRLEALNTFTTLADRFEGKRFNSPNDLCCTKSGVIFFTDPPYGLRGLSAKAEFDFSGVFRIDPDGTVSLVTRELAFPNGIGLSPDDKTLYVTSSDEKNPCVLAFNLSTDARPGPSRVLFDARPLGRKLGTSRPMDGMVADERGNLWSAGPGGIVVISPAGELLGEIRIDAPTANCAFGGPDGHSLFITAANTLLRVHTKVRGASFQ